jgi:hypothetical protein
LRSALLDHIYFQKGNRGLRQVRGNHLSVCHKYSNIAVTDPLRSFRLLLPQLFQTLEHQTQSQTITKRRLDMYVVATPQYIMAKNLFPNVLVQDFNTTCMFPFGVKFSFFSTLNGEGFVPDTPQTEAPIFGFYDAERMRDEIIAPPFSS